MRVLFSLAASQDFGRARAHVSTCMYTCMHMYIHRYIVWQGALIIACHREAHGPRFGPTADARATQAISDQFEVCFLRYMILGLSFFLPLEKDAQAGLGPF